MKSVFGNSLLKEIYFQHQKKLYKILSFLCSNIKLKRKPGTENIENIKFLNENFKVNNEYLFFTTKNKMCFGIFLLNIKKKKKVYKIKNISKKQLFYFSNLR